MVEDDVVLLDRLPAGIHEAENRNVLHGGLGLARMALEVGAAISTSVSNFSRSPDASFLAPSCWPYLKLAGLAEQVDSTLFAFATRLQPLSVVSTS